MVTDGLDEHLQKRPATAAVLRVDRYRRNTTGSVINGVVSAVIGVDSEDGGDNRPYGVDLTWHAHAPELKGPRGSQFYLTRIHPFERGNWHALLWRLSAIANEGVVVQHATSGRLVETWGPPVTPPPPGPHRATLVELGWNVDFDGRALCASREWPASEGKLARASRLIRRERASPSRVELRADDRSVEIHEDPGTGDAPKIERWRLEEVHRIAYLSATWTETERLVPFLIGADFVRGMPGKNPHPRVFSTNESRKAASAASTALAALLCITVARARAP